MLEQVMTFEETKYFLCSVLCEFDMNSKAAFNRLTSVCSSNYYFFFYYKNVSVCT